MSGVIGEISIFGVIIQGDVTHGGSHSQRLKLKRLPKVICHLIKVSDKWELESNQLSSRKVKCSFKMPIPVTGQSTIVL